MKITNNSKALQGIHTADGGVAYLAPGEARDLDVAEAELKSLKGVAFLGLEGVDRGPSFPPAQSTAPERDENGDTEEMAEMRRRFDAAFAERGEEIDGFKAGIAERDNTIAALQERIDVLQAPQKPTSVYAVVGKAGGWNVVTKNGVPVTKSLRDEAVKDFDAKPEEDKAAFVEANKLD